MNGTIKAMVAGLAMGCGLVLSLPAMAKAAKPASKPAASQFHWPNGAKAAIALTYDDSLDSQLDIALPALDAHGLKGTFFLILDRPTVMKRLTDYRKAASEGHELASHSLFHPCNGGPGREWVKPDEDLSSYTVGRMTSELRLSVAMLSLIDPNAGKTFAYPCYDSRTRDGSYYDAVKTQFQAARSATAYPSSLDPVSADLYSIPSYGKANATGEEMIAYVKSVQAVGGVGTFTFHGIGGDYLFETAEAHNALLDYLVANKKDVWVDTFDHITAYMKAERARIGVDPKAPTAPEPKPAGK